MEGKILSNRYLLAEEIGNGGMGTVHRATDLRTGGSVAVKIPHRYLVGDREYVERLRREAQIAASLVSPRVVRVMDLDTDDGLPFLVMEYVPGPTLGDLLKEAGRLERDDALLITLEVARALDAADQRGIVHRDLKPHNIKVVDDEVKVLDFGIARAEGYAGVTGANMFMGTPEYCAPERAEGEGDIRSDIYSLGIMLYEMLVGNVPFSSVRPVDVMRKQISDPPPPLPASIDPEVATIVMRCLEKRAEDRFQTPRELLAALGAALSLALPRGEPGHDSGRWSGETIPLDPAKRPHTPLTSRVSGSLRARYSNSLSLQNSRTAASLGVVTPPTGVNRPDSGAVGTGLPAIGAGSGPVARPSDSGGAQTSNMFGAVLPAEGIPRTSTGEPVSARPAIGSGPRLLVWVGGGVLTAAVIGGGALFALSRDKDGNAKPTPQPTSAVVAIATAAATATQTVAASATAPAVPTSAPTTAPVSSTAAAPTPTATPDPASLIKVAAIAIAPSRTAPERTVLETVNGANRAAVLAYRKVDAADLENWFEGELLEFHRGVILNELRPQRRFAVSDLLSVELRSISTLNDGRVRVVTREVSEYSEYLVFDPGRRVGDLNRRTTDVYTYTLVQRDGRWRVAVQDVQNEASETLE